MRKKFAAWIFENDDSLCKKTKYLLRCYFLYGRIIRLFQNSVEKKICHLFFSSHTMLAIRSGFESQTANAVAAVGWAISIFDTVIHWPVFVTSSAHKCDAVTVCRGIFAIFMMIAECAAVSRAGAFSCRHSGRVT